MNPKKIGKGTGVSLCLITLVSLVAAIPAWAGPAFQASSLPRTMRKEGRTELAGEVRLTVTNAGPLATITAGSSITVTYSAPITALPTPLSAIVNCTIHGVSGCPGDSTVQVAGNSVVLAFNSAVTLDNTADAITFSQVRVDASTLPVGTPQITAQISGGGGGASPITLTQATVPVGVPTTSLAASIFSNGATNNAAFGLAACVASGTDAVGFSFGVTEAFAGAFSSKAQELALAPADTVAGGSTLDVVFSNVPAGVTITPLAPTSVTASLTFGALPAAQTQTSTNAPMVFSFTFAGDDSTQLESAVLNFNAGTTSQVDLGSLGTSAISARVRIGPVSTASAPAVVSFADNTSGTGSPFFLAPCSLQATPNSTIKFSTVAGSGLTPIPGFLEVYDARASVSAYTISASTSNGGNWLRFSVTSATTPFDLALSVDATNLTAGTYNGQIVVTAVGATPVTIPVQLTVTANTQSTILLSPASLSFVADVGTNPLPQTIQVTNSGGGALGITATATTSTGANWLSVTPNTGAAPLTLTVNVASSTLVAGLYQGTITIPATGNGATNSPQVVSVSLAVGVPSIFPKGVVGAAGMISGASVTPGSIASLFGARLSATTTSATTLPLPLILGGTQVLVNGNAVPLFYVSPSQINFEMPVDATAATSTITVVSAGLTSAPITVTSGTVAPGIFATNGQGTGQAAALNSDFSANSATNPAAAGSGVSLYVTGLGATNPPVATGQAGSKTVPLNQTLVTPTVLINGVSANVSFAGLAPGLVGLYQINVTIPQGTAPGNAQVQVVQSNVTSNTVTIAVK